jgi:hypothetical protein
MENTRFKLTKTDLTKVGKGVLVAIVGAALTYLTEWAANTDFGSYTPVIVAGLSILANIVRKWSTPSLE